MPGGQSTGKCFVWLSSRKFVAMPWAHKISHKYQALFFLWMLLAVLMMGHWWNRQQFKAIEKSVNSLYKDRLMPATYLFQLDAYVYEKAATANTDTTGKAAMEKLMAAYEATYLTKEEAGDWKRFRLLWNDFHQTTERKVVATQLHECMRGLNGLQASVGRQLQRESRSLLGSAQLTAYLELAILFVFAVMGLMLARAMKDHDAMPQSDQWN